MNIYFKLLILFFLVCSAEKTYAIQNGDTVLVYFSDNHSVNTLYYDILRLKFKELNFKNIQSHKDFEHYIIYDLDDDKVQNGAGFNFMKYKKSKQAEQDTLHRKHYYFFDVGFTEKNTIPTTQNGYSYTYLDHFLYLKEYKGYITKNIVQRISLNGKFYNKKNIPIGKLDSISDFINPVFICFYLRNLLTPLSFEEMKKQANPCKIKETDTIYLSELLNRENVSRELAPRPPEHHFKAHLKYFKHAHVKLHNDIFSKLYLNAIKNNTQFFFYFYDEKNDRFFIIDGSDFSILTVLKAPYNRTYYQSRRYVKRCSKLSSKCRKHSK